MKKRILLGIIAVVLIFLVFWLNQMMTATTEREDLVRQEMQSYLNEKYAENMIVKNTSVMDGKVGVAYVSGKPDITFNVFGGEMTTKDFSDTYLSEYLSNATEEHIINVLDSNGYDNISVSLLHYGDADEKLYKYYQKYGRPAQYYELENDFLFGDCTIYYDMLTDDDMENIYRLMVEMKVPIDKLDNGNLDLDFRQSDDV